jgi:CheY-like chemotaxis protein
MQTKPTILLVDDDNDVRELAAAVLEQRGYRVHAASDGLGALKTLGHDDAIGLLVTDVVMPGPFDGWELAHRALEMRPGLPVLVMSGLVRNEARHADVANAPFLRKPWRPGELVEQVKLALRGRHPAARTHGAAREPAGGSRYAPRLSG